MKNTIIKKQIQINYKPALLKVYYKTGTREWDKYLNNRKLQSTQGLMPHDHSSTLLTVTMKQNVKSGEEATCRLSLYPYPNKLPLTIDFSLDSKNFESRFYNYLSF